MSRALTYHVSTNKRGPIRQKATHINGYLTDRQLFLMSALRIEWSILEPVLYGVHLFMDDQNRHRIGRFKFFCAFKEGIGLAFLMDKVLGVQLLVEYIYIVRIGYVWPSTKEVAETQPTIWSSETATIFVREVFGGQRTGDASSTIHVLSLEFLKQSRTGRQLYYVKY